MKRKFWSIINLVFLSVMIVSCSKDDPYAIYEFHLDCPSALLKYATPQVTYRDNEGAITFIIPDSEWTETGISNGITTVVIDGKTVISEPQRLKRWTKRVRYDEFPIKYEMRVVYTPKDNVPAGNVNVIENFAPTLSLNEDLWDSEGEVHHRQLDGSPADVAFGNGTSLADIISKYQNSWRTVDEK